MGRPPDNEGRSQHEETSGGARARSRPVPVAPTEDAEERGRPADPRAAGTRRDPGAAPSWRPSQRAEGEVVPARSARAKKPKTAPASDSGKPDRREPPPLPKSRQRPARSRSAPQGSAGRGAARERAEPRGTTSRRTAASAPPISTAERGNRRPAWARSTQPDAQSRWADKVEHERHAGLLTDASGWKSDDRSAARETHAGLLTGAKGWGDTDNPLASAGDRWNSRVVNSRAAGWLAGAAGWFGRSEPAKEHHAGLMTGAQGPLSGAKGWGSSDKPAESHSGLLTGAEPLFGGAARGQLSAVDIWSRRVQRAASWFEGAAGWLGSSDQTKEDPRGPAWTQPVARPQQGSGMPLGGTPGLPEFGTTRQRSVSRARPAEEVSPRPAWLKPRVKETPDPGAAAKSKESSLPLIFRGLPVTGELPFYMRNRSNARAPYRDSPAVAESVPAEPPHWEEAFAERVFDVRALPQAAWTDLHRPAPIERDRAAAPALAIRGLDAVLPQSTEGQRSALRKAFADQAAVAVTRGVDPRDVNLGNSGEPPPLDNALGREPVELSAARHSSNAPDLPAAIGGAIPPEPPIGGAQGAGRPDDEGREATIAAIMERDKRALEAWQRAHPGEPRLDMPHDALRGLIPRRVYELSQDPYGVDIVIEPGQNSENVGFFVIERRSVPVTDIDRFKFAVAEGVEEAEQVDPMHLAYNQFLANDFLTENDLPFYYTSLQAFRISDDADLYLRSIDVNKNMQRNGLARGFYESLRVFASESNFRYIVQESSSQAHDTDSDISTKAIFERLGFQRFSELHISVEMRRERQERYSQEVQKLNDVIVIDLSREVAAEPAPAGFDLAAMRARDRIQNAEGRGTPEEDAFIISQLRDWLLPHQNVQPQIKESKQRVIPASPDRQVDPQFVALYNRFEEVCGIVARRRGTSDLATVEDAVQKAYTEIYKNWENIENKEGIELVVLRSNSRYIDIRRHEALGPILGTIPERIELDLERAESTEISPYEVVVRRLETIQDILGNTPHAGVLIARANGLTISEIGSMLNVDVPEYRVRLYIHEGVEYFLRRLGVSREGSEEDQYRQVARYLESGEFNVEEENDTASEPLEMPEDIRWKERVPMEVQWAGRLVRQARKKYSVSDRVIAESLGLSLHSLYNFENGLRPLDLDRVMAAITSPEVNLHGREVDKIDELRREQNWIRLLSQQTTTTERALLLLRLSTTKKIDEFAEEPGIPQPSMLTSYKSGTSIPTAYTLKQMLKAAHIEPESKAGQLFLLKIAGVEPLSVDEIALIENKQKFLYVRTTLGDTMKNFSMKIPYSPEWVNDIESGRRKVLTRALEALVAVLGVSNDSALGRAIIGTTEEARYVQTPDDRVEILSGKLLLREHLQERNKTFWLPKKENELYKQVEQMRKVKDIFGLLFEDQELKGISERAGVHINTIYNLLKGIIPVDTNIVKVLGSLGYGPLHPLTLVILERAEEERMRRKL